MSLAWSLQFLLYWNSEYYMTQDPGFFESQKLGCKLGSKLKSQKSLLPTLAALGGFYWSVGEIVPDERHEGRPGSFVPTSPKIVQEREPIKATKVNSLIPHNGVVRSPRGVLDSALSTLILNS